MGFCLGWYRCTRGTAREELAIYGLAASAIGSLIVAVSSGGLVGWIVNLAILFVIYYLVVISRFEGEPKLVTTPAQPPVDRRGPPPAP